MLYVNPLLSIQPTPRGESAFIGPSREKAALEELERFFLFTLLQEMRKTIPADGFFEGSAEREIFDEMMDDALSGVMAQSGQLGISKMIEEQLRIAEAQHTLKQDLVRETGAALK